MPTGFDQYDKRGKQQILKLKKPLDGICWRSIVFFNHLTKQLIASGMIQSNIDPCLFICDKIICIVYVETLIFWSKDKPDIHNLEN